MLIYKLKFTYPIQLRGPAENGTLTNPLSLEIGFLLNLLGSN